MPRADFDKELRRLQDDVLMLGSMVEKAIAKSLEALKSRDLQLSQQVMDEDDVIDQSRIRLEEECVDLIATQQPLARDLRAIVAILHITSELERMGDYAEGISKISLMMGSAAPLKPLIDIPRMGAIASDMLKRSLDALVNRDSLAAAQVCRDDDLVDQLYDQVYRELLTFMIEDPRTIRRATYLLWIAHDLERIADRATNIAERVLYLVTGRIAEYNVPKRTA
jgi:phosphate transport system protein